MTQENGFPDMDINEDDYPQQDSQREEPFLNKEASPKPMPNSIKFGLILLPLAIVAIVAILFIKNVMSHQEQSVLDIDGEVMSVSEDETHMQTNTSMNIQTQKKQRVQAQDNTKDTLTLSSDKFSKLSEDVASLGVQIEDVYKVMNDFSKKIATLDTLKASLLTMEKRLDDTSLVNTAQTIEKIKQDLEKRLQEKSRALQASVDDIKKTFKKKSKRKQKSRLFVPFKLVSIDQWGGIDYVAIQSANVNEIENLKIGDARSGWILLNINPIAMSATFKHTQSGMTVTKNTI